MFKWRKEEIFLLKSIDINIDSKLKKTNLCYSKFFEKYFKSIRNMKAFGEEFPSSWENWSIENEIKRKKVKNRIIL